MPRRIDPANIRTGTGAAADESIENNALIHPTTSNEGLRVHILDPVRAHMASSVGVVDAGGNFVADEVEGALAELAGASSSVNLSRQFGWTEAGVADFDTAVTDVGLTITLAGTWVALISTGAHVASGDSVALPNNSTVWVYVDSATGVLTQSGSVPNISTDEDVIVGRFTTAAGAVTVKEDGRFFVINDNRKIDYTVRAVGTNVEDVNSEGAFMSLPAAFLWLGTFSGSGTTISQKTRVVVRGEHTLSAPLVFPVDNIVLEGEGDAVISTGASLDPMFDLNGQSGVEVRNLTLSCGHANSVAFASDSAPLNNTVIEDIILLNGGVEWLRGIDFDTNSTYSTRIGNVRADVGGANARGIVVSDPLLVEIKGCESRISGGSGTTYGIMVGGGAGCTVSGCLVIDAERAIYLAGSSHHVHRNTVLNTVSIGTAIHVAGGTTASSVTHNSILSASGFGFDIGIYVAGTISSAESHSLTVADNKINGVTDAGIRFEGHVVDSVIRGNYIDALVVGSEPTARGIDLVLTGTSIPSNNRIEGNTVLRAAEGIIGQGAWSTRATATVTVSDNASVGAGDTITIAGVPLTGAAGARTPGSDDFDATLATDVLTAAEIAAAINDTANSWYTDLVHAVASGNVVTLYAVPPGTTGNTFGLATSDAVAFTVSGALFSGGVDRILTGTQIIGNHVRNCAVSQSGAGPDTFAGAGCKGIGLEWAYGAEVSGNEIRETGIDLDATGTPSFPSSIGADVEAVGIYARNCSNTRVVDNSVFDTVSTGATSSTGILIEQRSSGIEPTFTLISVDHRVMGNTVQWQDLGHVNTIGASGTTTGIKVSMDLGTDGSTISHQTITSWVSNNTVSYTAADGIWFDVGNRAGLLGWSVENNAILYPGRHGIYANVRDPGAGVSGLSQISICAVRRNTVTGPSNSGILFSGTRAIGTNYVTDIDISDNTLFPVTDDGIAVVCVDGFSMPDIRVINNSLRSIGTDTAGNYAIVLDAGAGGGGSQDRWSVRGNEVIDHLDTTTWAIYLRADKENLSEWAVTDNRVTSTGGASAGGGIRVRTTLTGAGSASVRRGVCKGNTILSDGDGIYISARYEIDDLVVSDNTSNVTAAGVRPLHIECGLSASIGSESRGIIVSGNALQGGDGCLIKAGNDIRLTDVSVTGNTIFDVDQTAVPANVGEAAGLCIRMDSLTGTAPAMSNIEVVGNSFSTIPREGLYIYKGFIALGVERETNGITVANNTFRDCCTASDVEGALVIHAQKNVIGVTSNDVVQNLSILGNTFENCDPTCITNNPRSVGVICLQTGNLDSASISGNTFQGCAVSGDADANAGVDAHAGIILARADAAIRSLDITNNVMYSCSTTANVNGSAGSPEAEAAAILVSCTANVTATKVDGNIIREVDSTASTTGGATAAKTSFGSVLLISTASMFGNSISNNTITQCDYTENTSAGDTFPAVLLMLAVTACENLSVDCNKVRDVTWTGLTVPYVAGIVTDGALRSIHMSGNQFYNTVANGLFVFADKDFSGENLESVTIVGNIQHEEVATDFVGCTLAGENLYGATFSSNTLRNIASGFITIVQQDMASVSVTGNSFQNVLGGGTSASGILLDATNYRSISVTGNTATVVDAPSSGSQVFGFTAGTSNTGFVFSGNTIVIETADTNAVAIDMRGSTTDVAHSWTGNSVFVQDNLQGITRTAYTPTYTTITGNTSTTTTTNTWTSLVVAGGTVTNTNNQT